ncbi:MAG TPA: glycosyltransferase family 2 protein [Saprospiraceae bacterium]|nr:glycosyltransferase family 2 protein [Saprospiraceae bacterium]
MNTTTLEIIFWTCFFIVFYAYLGYGIVLWVLVHLKRLLNAGKKLPELPLPEITYVVCAYNEEDWIEQKIANSLALDYPRERILFCFVTDGSDDRTAELVRHYPYPAGARWTLLHQPERRGKIAAFQRAMQQVDTPIVVSTDANTLVNREAIRCIVRHFNDPKVGAVAGEKRISMGDKADAGSAGEGIYWQYESLLKKWDAELWTVVGAAGELFAFRTEVFELVPADTIVEDFYLTMRIAQKGYRVQYEPEAFAVESSSASVAEELKRKVRIAAGGLQAVVRLAPLLNIFRYGVLTFQYISHRALRWTLAPLCLPILFIVNLLLSLEGSRFYQAVLLVQILFYAAALAGYLLEKRKMKVKAFFVPYYFCVMNYSMYAGFWRLVRGRQSVLWERAKRA